MKIIEKWKFELLMQALTFANNIVVTIQSQVGEFVDEETYAHMRGVSKGLQDAQFSARRNLKIKD